MYTIQYKAFIDPHHEHVITGDLQFIQSPITRNIIRKGPKYRIPTHKGASHALDAAKTAINNYTARQSTKHLHHSHLWHEINNIFTNNFEQEINRIKQKATDNNNLPHQPNKIDLNNIKSHFVITTVDKATQNFSFTCKAFYLNHIYNILNSDTKTYERCLQTPYDTICNLRKIMLEAFNLKTPHDLELPYIQITPKFHKTPTDFRTIIASKYAITKPISVLLSNTLKLIQYDIKCYCEVIQHNTGINTYWIIDNRDPILNALHSLSSDRNAKSIQTYDFGQMYTNLEHTDILIAIQHVLSIVFRKTKHIWVNQYTASHSKLRGKCHQLDKHTVLQMVEFIVNNSHFQFGNSVYRQIVGIPMGTSCAPYLANLTLFSLEFKYMTKLLSQGKYSTCRNLNYVFRYIDDISILNDYKTFEKVFKHIYPNTLTLKKVNNIDSSADVLDINVRIVEHAFITTIYDKRRDFPFDCNTLPPFDTELSMSCRRNVVFNEITRIFSICSNHENFSFQYDILKDILWKRGYHKSFTDKQLAKFKRTNHINFSNKFNLW